MVLMLSGDVGRVFWSLDFELNKEFSWARFRLVRIRFDKVGDCGAFGANHAPRAGSSIQISESSYRTSHRTKFLSEKQSRGHDHLYQTCFTSLECSSEEPTGEPTETVVEPTEAPVCSDQLRRFDYRWVGRGE